MPYLRHLESVIHQGGQDTGPVVGTITTTLVTPRWLRFRPVNVLGTVTGLDEVEAWVRGARTAQQACAVHHALEATYRARAHAAAGVERPQPVLATPL